MDLHNLYMKRGMYVKKELKQWLKTDRTCAQNNGDEESTTNCGY